MEILSFDTLARKEDVFMSEKHSGQADASVSSAEQRKALPLPLILFLTATCILSSSIFSLMLSGKEKLTFIFSVVVCLLCSIILFFGVFCYDTQS